MPFTQKKGLIYVQALWAGKQVNCVIDTGEIYISWPQTLNLKASPTGKQVQMLGIGCKHRILGEWVLYQFSVKLHIILTPPNLPLARGRAVGGGVLSMLLHKKLVLAPNIKLGGFQLENIFTISEKIVEKVDGQKTSIAEAEGINEIILGNTVFQNLVLTIDYKKQEIILRDKDYDIR